MALILNIETATTNCSVSIAKTGQMLALEENNSKGYAHAELLHVYIKKVLERANLKPVQLDAVAVSKGPGSYTGLRIGVSAAKGLCFAIGKPLIATDTLQSLALQVKNTPGAIVPMLDARRMEVYTAVFDNNHRQICPTEAKILDETSFKDLLDDGLVCFIGDGVEKAKSIISHPNAMFIEHKFPSVQEMAMLSFEKYKSNDFEDVAYFEPYYLKEFMGNKL
ncbi:MAG TPA: tRNA (adenosine(37)-N6)-threonylcarbamoyltransferase complex dimerization subunit type 1 TsaB [Aquaticitalea sp.]|nr:tRNA (adenosine(37)-N6)-threonylcarbamoyltransferase complex dimerization subunit type 1 TsaB [Aquaticitalea sp.]HNU59842.1 tRNA (adenosine(37)-N6)-threonylcarbamoyltransferase complex dimerization subunit type 1 TsaB [Aquaticitalea sp.]